MQSCSLADTSLFDYSPLDIPSLIQEAASTQAVPEPTLWKLLSRFPANIFNPHSATDEREAYLKKNRELREAFRQKIDAVTIPKVSKGKTIEMIHSDAYPLSEKYLIVQKLLKEDALSIEEAATLLMQINFYSDFVDEPKKVTKIVLPKGKPIPTKILANLLLFTAPKWLYDKLCAIPTAESLFHLIDCILKIEELIQDVKNFIKHPEALEEPRFKGTYEGIDKLFEPINELSSNPVEKPEQLLRFLQASQAIAATKQRLAFINFLGHMGSELERTFLLIPFEGLAGAFSKKLSNDKAPFLVKMGYSTLDSEKEKVIIAPSFSMMFYTTYYLQSIEPGTITIPVGGVPDFKFLAEIGLNRARILSLPTGEPFIDIEKMQLHGSKIFYRSIWTWHDQVHLHRFACTNPELVRIHSKYCLSLRKRSVQFEGKLGNAFTYWRDELVGDFDYPYMTILYDQCDFGKALDPKLQNLAVVSTLYQFMQRLIRFIEKLNPGTGFQTYERKYFGPLKEVINEFFNLTERFLNQRGVSIRAVMEQKLPSETAANPTMYFGPWKARKTNTSFFNSKEEDHVFGAFQDILKNFSTNSVAHSKSNR